MKISSLSRFKTPILAMAMSCVPVKTVKNINIFSNNVNFKNTVETVQDITHGLKTEFVTNFRGGITERYDSLSLATLKQRITNNIDGQNIRYCFPIKEKDKAYTCPFGYFLAQRPQNRFHMGLDIFVTPYSKKPKEPVTIVAPVDGIVISNKFARANDNVIGNSISILGVDGHTYAFDHMAKGSDYADSIVRPKIGEKIKMGTPIGYIGSTGETTMWHLHFVVMTDEQLMKQLNDTTWLNRAKSSPYMYLKGQVDPINPKQAGRIADVLNEILK